MGNPIFEFRAPPLVPLNCAVEIVDGHFMTKRGQVVNDSRNVVSIYPDDNLTYKADPSLEVQFKFLENLSVPGRTQIEQAEMLLDMTSNGGFQPCRADEWTMGERLAGFLRANDEKVLSLNGQSSDTFLLMWRPGSIADAEQRQLLAWGDAISASAEDGYEGSIAESVRTLQRHYPGTKNLGVSVVNDKDDDTGDDGPLPKRTHKPLVMR